MKSIALCDVATLIDNPRLWRLFPPIHPFYSVRLTGSFEGKLHIVAVHLGEIGFVVHGAAEGDVLEGVV